MFIIIKLIKLSQTLYVYIRPHVIRNFEKKFLNENKTIIDYTNRKQIILILPT